MRISRTGFLSTISSVAMMVSLGFSAEATDYLDVWGGPNFAVGGAGKFARDDMGEGAFGFVEAGFDIAVPNSKFIVGVVGNYDTGRFKEEYENSGFELEFGDSWGIGARAGIKTMHSLLIYGVGGFAQAEISEDCIGACKKKKGGSNDIEDDWHSGYFLGAGVEKAISEKVAAKLEYRYEDYGDIDEYEDLESHGVRGSVVFRLGHHGDE